MLLTLLSSSQNGNVSWKHSITETIQPFMALGEWPRCFQDTDANSDVIIDWRTPVSNTWASKEHIQAWIWRKRSWEPSSL